jgi:hypothetical protein
VAARSSGCYACPALGRQRLELLGRVAVEQAGELSGQLGYEA